MLKIAVLGSGRIGRMHAENIHAHPPAELAGVFDVVAKASHDVARTLGVTEIPAWAEKAGSRASTTIPTPDSHRSLFERRP